MSENQTESAETATEVSEAPQMAVLPEDHPLVKTLAAQKLTIKELKDKAARLDELESAQLSESEKAKKRAEQAEARALAAEASAARWRIAAKHGISDEDAELLLTGTDEETLNRQAERLAARTPSKNDGLYVPAEGKVPSAPALNSDDLESALKSKLNIR